MKTVLPTGKYVVAVSGGVDSMTLLHLLMQRPKHETQNTRHEFVVTHFNHGIRPDAGDDEKLVKETAKKYGLTFEVGYGKLGAAASEERARRARYAFLEKVRAEYQAEAIITAHHQDDQLETAIINILRGTGRRGLTALARNPIIKRPLLPYSKREIINYAKKHNLQWRDDPTNLDTKYLRNYVRLKIIPKFSNVQRQELLSSLTRLTRTNKAIDEETATLSRQIEEKNGLNRQKFTNLPTEISKEVLMYWLRKKRVRQFDKQTINRLTVVIRTGRPGTTHEVIKGVKLHLTKIHTTLINPAPKS